MNRAALRLILPGRVAGAGGAGSAAAWGGGTFAVQRDCGSGKEIVMPSFLPDADGELLTWSVNFASLLSATPAAFGISQAQADAFETLQIAYAQAFQRAKDFDTRTRPAVAAKNATREAMKQSARRLAKIIDGTESVNNAQRVSLGLTVRKRPTRIPAPTVQPALNIVSVVGRSVIVNIHELGSSSAGKPDGAHAAYVYTCVGKSYPIDPTGWQFQGAYTKPECRIDFPNDLPAGTDVWICAAWINAKQETGPLSAPISTTVQHGLAMSFPIKLAA